MSACWTHEQDGLPGHPAHRQQRLALDPVIVGAEDAAADAEVGYFDGVLVSNETVPSGQITMHHVQRLQVLHAGRYLSRHVDQTAVTTPDRRADHSVHQSIKQSRK